MKKIMVILFAMSLFFIPLMHIAAMGEQPINQEVSEILWRLGAKIHFEEEDGHWNKAVKCDHKTVDKRNHHHRFG